ncbi:MAG: hypothetical protein M3071_07015 [Actinomycetota bacterium]|nr:hypothetical protein [Actinomycetota bacterium]
MSSSDHGSSAASTLGFDLFVGVIALGLPMLLFAVVAGLAGASRTAAPLRVARQR